MTTKTYKDQVILHYSEARLIPPNSDYPDCMCTLVMTESNFYAMERRYDGTYDEYFDIPVKQLRRIELFKQNDGRGFAPLVFLIGLLGGWFVIKDTWGMKKRDYLEIEYQNEQSENITIRFHELDGDTRRLAKDWK